jgi:uncharacterized protein (TIGR02145 family)
MIRYLKKTCWLLLIDVMLIITSVTASASDALFTAASTGDVVTLQRLLDEKADINEIGSIHMTPLMVASYFGKSEIVKILLASHADINIQSGSGLTALMIASQKGHAEIVKMLLDAGAKKSLKSTSGTTALTYATEKGYEDVQSLLKTSEMPDVVQPVSVQKEQKVRVKPTTSSNTKSAKKSAGIAVNTIPANPAPDPITYTAGANITDADGNIYSTVKIGTQTWMAENLRTTKYLDGTLISLVTDEAQWGKLSTPGYCWYNNNATVNKKYGILYNWYAMDFKKIAPAGWHVPTDVDWIRLENYLIDNKYNYDGSVSGNFIAKSLAAQKNWAASAITGSIGNTLSKNNKTGFSALPGGFRNTWGKFDSLGNVGWFWSATESDALTAYSSFLNLGQLGLSGQIFSKNCGFSVRLVKDK